MNYKQELIELVAELRNRNIAEHCLCCNGKKEDCLLNRARIEGILKAMDEKLKNETETF